MVGFKFENYVRLQDLPSPYNGKLARILSLTSDDHGGRYRVVLQTGEIATHLNHKILVKPENMARACDGCHHAGAATMQYCGNCKNAAYCNAECQRNDWNRHKVVCSNMNAVRQIVKSPLNVAAAHGNLVEVEKLVRAGADVNKVTKDGGTTALLMAAQNGSNLDVIQYLIQQGADKDKASKDDLTKLFVAAEKNHLAVVRYLVQQGADKNKADNDGLTPLAVATDLGHIAVAQYLREQGAI